MKLTDLIKVALASATLVASLGAAAQEALIRKNPGERIPQLQKIGEVAESPMPGLFEIRANGTKIFYSDAAGNSPINGHLTEAKN